MSRSLFGRPPSGNTVLGFTRRVSKRIRNKMTNVPKKTHRLTSDAGVGVVELIIVVAVVGIVSVLAIMSFQRSSRSFNLAGATRNLSTYLEKARVDSVRRHGGANLVLNSATGYTANIDFDGSGTSTARTITLPAGTSLRYTLPPATTSIDPSVTPITITYDWRGRTASTVVLSLTDSFANVSSSTVVVGAAGDLSTDTTVTGPVTAPTPQNTSVTTTTGIKGMH